MKRSLNSLWYLATEILGYGWNSHASPSKESPFPGKGLTAALHKPVCDWHDRHRGTALTGLFMPRYHHKTTIKIAEIIQDLLWNPFSSILYWHRKDELAGQVIYEVGRHFQNNPKLRALDPIGTTADGKPFKVMPAINSKQFMRSDQLKLRRPPEVWTRFPSLYASGVGSVMAGIHGQKGYLDDIIDRQTIEKSQLGDTERWVNDSVFPIVDDGLIRASGTLWDPDACYCKWIADPDWWTILLPCAVGQENDILLHPEKVDWTAKKIALPKDDTLEYPIYGDLGYRETQIRRLKLMKRQMKAEFESQMQNDPSPAGEKPWVPMECERFVSKSEALTGRGWMVLIHDPAPTRIGSISGLGERLRGDGTKDDWAYAIVRFQIHGQLRRVVLITGDYSTEWDDDKGFSEACREQIRWGVGSTAIECNGAAGQMYPGVWDRVATRLGAAKDLVEMRSTQIGKNARFGDLCAMARNGEFVICKDTCNPKFLEKFLEQCRGWRPLDGARGSKNGLRHDDAADVVAMVCDDGIMDRAPSAPSPEMMVEMMDEEAMYLETSPRVRHFRGF